MAATTIEKPPVRPATRSARFDPIETARLIRIAQEGSQAAPDETEKRERGIAARNEVVVQNLGLIGAIVSGYLRSHPHWSLDELVDIGVFGLFRAIERFDPDRNVQFSTYASYWIKQTLRRTIDEETPLIRLPAYASNLVSRYGRARRRLENELERSVAQEEVVEQLKLPALKQASLAMALRSQRRVTESGDAGRADWKSLIESCPDEREEPALYDEDIHAALATAIARLDEFERKILTLHWGLGGNRVHSLDEIGKQVGHCKNWVYEIEKQAIAKLKRAIKDIA